MKGNFRCDVLIGVKIVFKKVWSNLEVGCLINGAKSSSKLTSRLQESVTCPSRSQTRKRLLQKSFVNSSCVIRIKSVFHIYFMKISNNSKTLGFLCHFQNHDLAPFCTCLPCYFWPRRAELPKTCLYKKDQSWASIQFILYDIFWVLPVNCEKFQKTWF